MSEPIEAVVVQARFDGVNNMIPHVPALIRKARAEAKRNGYRLGERVFLQVTVEAHPRED